MLTSTISKYSGISPNEVDRLLAMSSHQVFNDPAFQGMVNDLDRKFLEDTVTDAREAYRGRLDDFSARLERKYNLENPAMSAFTLANWLVGFLYSPDNLGDLLDRHERVPKEALREGLPELLGILDNMGEGRKEWQAALSLLSIPLVANG